MMNDTDLTFHLAFGNQGPRVWRKGGEAHSSSCLKSSVKFPQSVMIWGAMSSAGVGPLCFLKTNVLAPVFKDADFIFQQDLVPAHTAKSTKSWLNVGLQRFVDVIDYKNTSIGI